MKIKSILATLAICAAMTVTASCSGTAFVNPGDSLGGGGTVQMPPAEGDTEGGGDAGADGGGGTPGFSPGR